MQIYNTLTRKKEEIVPIQPGHIGIYACGPIQLYPYRKRPSHLCI